MCISYPDNHAQVFVALYRSQVRPSLTFSAAAWYPYTNNTQREQLEKTQKLALRIIFPGVDHQNERLALAGINPLNAELDLICARYASNVYQIQSHPLHNRIPKRPESQRYSRRISTSDIYVPKLRTDKCKRSVLKSIRYFS